MSKVIFVITLVLVFAVVTAQIKFEAIQRVYRRKFDENEIQEFRKMLEYKPGSSHTFKSNFFNNFQIL